MKSENYGSVKSFSLGVILLLLTACNNGSGKNEQRTAAQKDAAQTENQQTKMALDFFDLPDSTIKTTAGKAVKICIPIAKNTNNPNFSVTMTKPPQYGTLSSTISGNLLCFEYVPKANYLGLDQFDCKVCFTSSGFCEERTWHIEVKNGAKEVRATSSIPSDGSPNPPRVPAIKKEEPKEIVPTPVSSSSSIFDASKKNNDGYVPKN